MRDARLTTMPADLDIRDSRLVRLLAETPCLERLAGGFDFTEGPVWHDGQQCLFFTDIAGNKIYRWSEMDGLSAFRSPSQMANGLALDHQGRLLCCEHATSRLTRHAFGGAVEVLAERYDGKELNSPNDVIVSRDGTIYFTDPAYGREDFWGIRRDEELGFRGVYAIDPDAGELRLLISDFVAPNGLCLTADERVMFINDSERQHVRRFDVRADGALEDGRIWATLDEIGPGSPDGMKLNASGHVFCCGPGGIHVFAPDAQCLGIIRMPEFAANLAFGGQDGSDLFITATTSLYRLRMAPGAGARH